MAYSAMNSVARAQLETVLKRAVPESLAELGPEKFVQQLAEIYVNLDYLHPFLDGNSRTLRSFTRQLARGAGYELDWSVFNASPIARDMLYIARCKSVNTLALPQKGNYTADAKAANQTCDTHNTS